MLAVKGLDVLQLIGRPGPVARGAREGQRDFTAAHRVNRCRLGDAAVVGDREFDHRKVGGLQSRLAAAIGNPHLDAAPDHPVGHLSRPGHRHVASGIVALPREQRRDRRGGSRRYIPQVDAVGQPAQILDRLLRQHGPARDIPTV